MNNSDLLTLYNYSYWANQRVLSAAGLVTAEQFIAPAGLSHGSLRGALVHIYAAEVVWRMRCQEGVSPRALPAEADYPTLESLRAAWLAEEGRMRLYLASLSDEDLQQPVRYTTTKGVPYENVLWQLLAHVVNHGTQFRAEAGIALTACGHSPGDLDLLLYLRERASLNPHLCRNILLSCAPSTLVVILSRWIFCASPSRTGASGMWKPLLPAGT